MEILDFVFMIYKQLEDCPIEYLEEVFKNTQQEIKNNHPEVYKRMEEIMNITEKTVISVRKKKPLTKSQF